MSVTSWTSGMPAATGASMRDLLLRACVLLPITLAPALSAQRAFAEPSYVVRLDNMKLWGTVSPSSDTDTVVFTVKIGDQVFGPRTAALGDLRAVNTYSIEWELGDVPINDDTEVLITYQVINSGQGADPGQIVQTVGGVVKAVGPLGDLIAPGVGEVIAGIGSVAQTIGGALSPLWSFTNCDKILINEAVATKGSIFRQAAGAKNYITVVKNYDVGGPPGFNFCNGHVTYTLAFSILPTWVRIDNRNSGLSLDVVGGSTQNGAAIQQYTSHSGPDQQWRIVPTNAVENSGSVALVSVNSGKAIDVPNGSHDANVLIQQYVLHGGANQRWIFEPSRDGQTVQLVNEESKLALDVPNGSTTSGVLIQQYPPNTGDNQQWRILPGPM